MNKFKIGILTQPLGLNYGGLIQNFALQKVLTDSGFIVETLRVNQKYRFFKKILRFLGKYICNLPFICNTSIAHKLRKLRVVSNTELFISRNLNIVNISSSHITMKDLSKLSFDAFIVGSDQVWRPKYSPYLPNYFFDFLRDNNNVKKIAYASSFGVDIWEFDNEQTFMAKDLISQFDLVTVREDSAVNLCKTYLNSKAYHVLDPTMLLPVKEYISLINKLDDNYQFDGYLNSYILDMDNEKKDVINNLEKILNLKQFTVLGNDKYKKENSLRSETRNSTLPPVEKWLKSFYDAKFVITDSFHGTVFSIIFNKPFIVYLNNDRGASRFLSLLKMFNLESRLIHSLDDLQSFQFTAIDYNHVNTLLEQYRIKSMSILIDELLSVDIKN